jgi:uncharacterized protein GlcG (DUF336 family)
MKSRLLSGAILAAGMAAIFASPVHAQSLVQRNISLAQAMRVAEAVNASCGAPDRQSMTIAVVDRGGAQVLGIRADTAGPHNWVQVYRKAYTALTFSRPSAQWRDDSAPSDARYGQRQLDIVVPLAGGAPIRAGNEIIGAVGVSGAQGGQPADDACAQAGAAAIGDE